jgi:hypothetical protein
MTGWGPPVSVLAPMRTPSYLVTSCASCHLVLCCLLLSGLLLLLSIVCVVGPGALTPLVPGDSGQSRWGKSQKYPYWGSTVSLSSAPHFPSSHAVALVPPPPPSPRPRPRPLPHNQFPALPVEHPPRKAGARPRTPWAPPLCRAQAWRACYVHCPCCTWCQAAACLWTPIHPPSPRHPGALSSQVGAWCAFNAPVMASGRAPPPPPPCCGAV